MHYGNIIFPDNLFSWLIIWMIFFFFGRKWSSLIYYYIHFTCLLLVTEWLKSSICWGIAPIEQLPHSPRLVQHVLGSLYVLDEDHPVQIRGPGHMVQIDECCFSIKEDEESVSKTRKAEMDLWWQRLRDKRGLPGWSIPERCCSLLPLYIYNHIVVHIARQ